MKCRCAIILLAIGGSMSLIACGHPDAPVPFETVRSGPLSFAVEAPAEVISSRPTPLIVPGSSWTSRQIEWMAPDGAVVKRGELVAKFRPDESMYELSKASLDIERVGLARQERESDLSSMSKRIRVDLATTAVELAVAERYAKADLSYMSTRDILNAVEDRDLLLTRLDIARERLRRSGMRGDAELALIDAQMGSHLSSKASREADLRALELRAPHDGILFIKSDWTGAKPMHGSSLLAGQDYGSLADTSAMEVRIDIPQVDAEGIELGTLVELRPVGQLEPRIFTRISWIASNPLYREEIAPTKVLMVKSRLQLRDAERMGVTPGQRLMAKVIVMEKANAMSLSNLAIQEREGTATVKVLKNNEYELRKILIGARGSVRSEVLSGVRIGDRVALVAANIQDRREK